MSFSTLKQVIVILDSLERVVAIATCNTYSLQHCFTGSGYQKETAEIQTSNSDSHGSTLTQDNTGETRNICGIGGSVALSQLETHAHKLGTMQMHQNNTEIEATIELSSPSSPDVTLKLIPKFSLSDMELLKMSYKAKIEISEISTKPEVEFQAKKMTKNFTLPSEDCLQWKLLSRDQWAQPNGCPPEIYISISILLKNFSLGRILSP